MDSASVGYSYHLPTGGWNYKIRNTLSQFSDLFSEFNKYIAPAYHHDRCERSVQMRIYSMHKGEFVMVFIAFWACFGLGIFIGLAGPPPMMTTSVTASSILENNATIYQGPFHVRSHALSTRAQELFLMAEILTNNDDEEIFDKSFQISISIEGMLEEHTALELFGENETPNRTQHLRCQKRVCEEVMILHLGYTDFKHYLFNMYFYGLKEFHKRYFIRDIVFYFRTYNPAFTQMETWFRFIFVVTSFCVCYWFFYVMRKYPFQDWSNEQFWLSKILPLLMTFNDPAFPLRLFALAPRYTCFVSDFMQLTFLAFVLISWLALYHGLRQNDRNCFSFYTFKIIVVMLCFIPALIMSYWQKVVGINDPTYNYMMNPNYPLVKIMFFSALTLYFLYLLVLVIKAYSDLRNMPFFDIRLRCLSAAVSTLSASGVCVLCRGGGVAALREHWARTGTSATSTTSAPFMALLGLFNFSAYAMAYLFTPGTAAPHETAITKDNPAFSMINDSDEEVIYGSDEESRRPLNSHHRIADEDI